MTTALGFGDGFWLENRRRTYACRLVMKVARSTAPLLLDAVRPDSADAAGPPGVVPRHFPLVAEAAPDAEPEWVALLRDRLRRLPPADLAAAGGYCDATAGRFADLSGAPMTGEPEWLRGLRGSLKYLAGRFEGFKSRDPSARDDLLNTAAVLWLDAVRPRRRPDERGLSLPEDLALSLPRLRGPDGAKVLLSAVGDGLRQAEDPSLPFRAHQLRQWRRLLALSHLVLPAGADDAGRCTQAHFAALADHIRRELPGDKNLPRSVHLIGALFFLFCACCAGTRSQPDEDEEEPVEAGAVEEAEAVQEVAPEAADELVGGARRLVARELPSAGDQAILAHLLGVPSLLGRAARSRLAGVNDRVLSDRTRLMAALGMDERAFKAERDRLRRWWVDARGRLRPDAPQAEGDP